MPSVQALAEPLAVQRLRGHLRACSHMSLFPLRAASARYQPNLPGVSA